MPAAFRGSDQGTLFAFRRDLLLHRVQDFLGRRQVLDFIAQHFDTPVQGRFVNRLNHLGVDDVAFLKGLVKFEFADHRAQRCLRQLGDCRDVVARAVAGAHGVGHLEIKNAVDLQLRVVAGDADLACDVERDFLENVFVGHLVDERHQKAKARRQRAVVLSEALDHPGVLLGHDLDRLRDKDSDDEEQYDGDFH